MNHLQVLQLSNLRLVARNEGKIKSYDSCTDLRAWSHDLAAQDLYLREWMKADAPASIIPCNCLAGCLSRMTCKSRRRVIPHCHPDCKSRVLLESIYNSCQAVKECLRQDRDLEKYFVEEEFESSHWPCDRCLEALKSIKMFWKIIITKLFGINLTKCEGLELDYECVDSVKSIARVWQSDMIHQANYVKKLAPGLCRESVFQSKTPSMLGSLLSPPKSFRSCCIGDNCDIKTNAIQPPRFKNVSNSTSVKLEITDHECNTSNDIFEAEICAYKRKIASLQAKCNVQWEDVNRLRKENIWLRKEKNNVRNGCLWKSPYCIPEVENICHRSVTCLIQKPFEAHLADNYLLSNVDSEMIITIKNGKNQMFRHVSLLQVLHKTNEPILQDINTDKSCSIKEDPIEILNKVHFTVGAIVKREMYIANERESQPNKIKVDASFHRAHNCKSATSCLSICSCTSQSSATEFVSPKRNSYLIETLSCTADFCHV